MRKAMLVCACGFAFIFLISILMANLDLVANPWIKTARINLDDLGILSRPALLYYYLPSKFWLQAFLISLFGSLWTMVILIFAKRKS